MSTQQQIPAVQLRDLTKSFGGVRAVDGLSFTIPTTGCFALLGVNGAGKTTTIRMLCGLTAPDSGDALLLGHSVVHHPQQVRQVIGVSLQETAIAPNLTVCENLQLMAALTCTDGSQCVLRVQQALEQLSLEQVVDRRAKTLSGGWQRRLSIAMALISRPKILFLDEPTLGLDILARRELWQVIQVLSQQVAVVLTTHYLEEAQALAQNIAVLAKGQLRAVGSVRQLCDVVGCDNFEDAFVALAGEVPE